MKFSTPTYFQIRGRAAEYETYSYFVMLLIQKFAENGIKRIESENLKEIDDN